ncbi:MAG: type II toxin-antitoxin system RelE/ParE family toxin [Gemmatimonadetes bacterium]|nr:type II toxin-antitoxin system RelE/ParE family toxin [Gemmatimonadota bacterium]
MLAVVRVGLHPEARAEVRAAALWYEERSPGLGDRFVERVNEVLERLEVAPAIYPIWPGTESAPSPIRKAVLEQFPYLVAFELHPESVWVLAVAHAKRQPLYWLARTSQRPG